MKKKCSSSEYFCIIRFRVIFSSMAKVKPFGMPVEVVLHSKHLAFAGGAFERAIWIIACRFWASGAVLDGFDDAAACQISKIQGAHWERLKTPVMAALADILPELQRRHAIAQASRENITQAISASARKGRLVMMERRKAKLEECQSTERMPETAGSKALITPHKAARYVNDKAVMSPQKLAALSTDALPEARFGDK